MPLEAPCVATLSGGTEAIAAVGILAALEALAVTQRSPLVRFSCEIAGGHAGCQIAPA
jgi:hypothetical protein